MTEKCAVHDTCFQSLERQYTEMEKKIDDLREDIRELAEKLDKWGTGVAIHGNQLDTAFDTIRWLKKKYEILESELGKLKFKLAAMSATVSLLVTLLFLYIKSKGL